MAIGQCYFTPGILIMEKKILQGEKGCQTLVFMHLEVKAEAGSRCPVHLVCHARILGGPPSAWVMGLVFCCFVLLLFEWFPSHSRAGLVEGNPFGWGLSSLMGHRPFAGLHASKLPAWPLSRLK